MGLLAIILLGINGIIGSGAFLLPSEIYNDAGFLLGLATLFAGGLATLFIVFSYADLAGKIPGDGGAWLYCYNAWGRFAGFQVGIFVWFAGLATISTEIAALIRIFKNQIPALGNSWVANGVGAAVIALLAFVNWFGPKLVQLVDNISSGVKIATAVFFIGGAAFAMKLSNFKPLLPTDVTSLDSGFSAIGSAYSVAFYLFAGFSFLTIAGSKMKNSQKNLPKALVTVIISVTILYMLIQAVTVGILGSGTGKSSVPVAEAAKHALGEWAYYIVIAGTAVAVFGVAFACSFEVPVLAASLATEHKLLPPIFGKRNKHGSPSIAILVTAGLAMLMLFTGDYVFLAKLVVGASAIQYVPTILAVLKLRNTPSAPGAFQLKGAHRWIVTVIALVASSYLFLSYNGRTLTIIMLVFLAGAIIFFVDEKRQGLIPVDAGIHLLEPRATRAGSAVIDRSTFPDRVRAALRRATAKPHAAGAQPSASAAQEPASQREPSAPTATPSKTATVPAAPKSPSEIAAEAALNAAAAAKEAAEATAKAQALAEKAAALEAAAAKQEATPQK